MKRPPASVSPSPRSSDRRPATGLRARDAQMSAATRAKTASTGALSGTEKVAVLLLALGKDRSAKLLKKFDPEELKQLTRSAADLRPVRMSDLETLVEEFAQTFSSGVGFAGTV